MVQIGFNDSAREAGDRRVFKLGPCALVASLLFESCFVIIATTSSLTVSMDPAKPHSMRVILLCSITTKFMNCLIISDYPRLDLLCLHANPGSPLLGLLNLGINHEKIVQISVG